MKKISIPTNPTPANVGYKADLWQMADALRGSMDAAEYKHVVLGLIFLKYISNAFSAGTGGCAVTGMGGRMKGGRMFQTAATPACALGGVWASRHSAICFVAGP